MARAKAARYYGTSVDTLQVTKSNGKYPTMDYGLFNIDQTSDRAWGPLGPPKEFTELQIGERTGIQSVITSPWVLRWQALPTTYNTYRAIRKHPTIALARAMSAAPILAGEWTVNSKDGVPESLVKFIQNMLLPFRQTFLETALWYGNCDFGYQGYEKVYDYDQDGYLTLIKLKPLLHDITEIIIAPNGEFEGFKQPATWLGLQNALLVPFRVEGSMWYGAPLLENCRTTYYQWLDAADAASRYDRKIAGGRVDIGIPPGATMDETGKMVSNMAIAKKIAESLESSGIVIRPRDMAGLGNTVAPADMGFTLDIIDKGTGGQVSFVQRLDYLDKLMVRGLLFPERVFLEGTHGTKAETEAQTDTALSIPDECHKYVLKTFNTHVVNPILLYNFGEKALDSVWIEAVPIADDKKTYLRTIMTALLTNPQGFIEVFPQVDLNALMDSLGVPKAKEVSWHDSQEGTGQEDGQTPGEQTPQEQDTSHAVPLGVDPNSAVAASIRRIYARLHRDWGVIDKSSPNVPTTSTLTNIPKEERAAEDKEIL